MKVVSIFQTYVTSNSIGWKVNILVLAPMLLHELGSKVFVSCTCGFNH
jgi:hypothetical protein